MDDNIGKEKAKVYFLKNQKIHITLEKRFYNGYIVAVGAKEIIFKDDKIQIPLTLLYLEIIDMQPYQEPEVKQ